MPQTWAMWRIGLISLSLILAGCGARGPSGDAHASAAKPHVIAANFSDADPHPWADPSAASLPVRGIDVSRFQTSVDWQSARAGGVNFAFIKATEGGDGLDPMFADHWRAAGRAGVLRGAYLFYYHCRAPEDQARWFFQHVPRTPGALPPVLDMEWTPTSPTCTIRRNPDVIRADARRLIQLLTAHYGTRPILYTTVDFFEDNALGQLGGVDFWLRSVAAHPADRYAGQHWTFWQYSATGLVPGIKGRVDLNTFAGSRGAWADWLERRVQ